MLIQKGMSVVIIFLFIGTCILPSSVAQNSNEKSSLLILDGNHAPIRIIGNDQFTPENGVTGGSGTEDDPYIIENWVIVCDGSASQGIFINDTDVYFIIRNCTISGFHHPDEFRQGIKLSEVTNGRIEDTKVSECAIGIDIWFSTENKIINCTCSDYPVYPDGYGIAIFQSTNITIISSICYNMRYGIDISESSDITVQKTECYNNTDWGLFAGVPRQNIMNFLIEDCMFKNNGQDGIWFSGSARYTSCSIIRNCSFYGNQRGIFLQHVSDNIIENCVFDHNKVGMYLDDRAGNNIIRNCSFHSHTYEAVQIAGLLFFSRNNEISYCDFIDNNIGIILISTRRNKIHHCVIENNSYIGVVSAGSDARITSNNIFNNGRDYPVAPDPAGVYSWRSFLDVRHNWWGSSHGPSISLFIGFKNWKIVPIRTVDNSDVVMLRNGLALRFPWLSEPVPDAGRQT
ncbi:MAG: right-handed parallel beta-helix repeat-containing protein [Thermoplasmata archaeon]|nr:right-handed parallel beta-helix repeat-containing protein [Thermoplasmata archaeon]